MAATAPIDGTAVNTSPISRADQPLEPESSSRFGGGLVAILVALIVVSTGLVVVRRNNGAGLGRSE